MELLFKGDGRVVKTVQKNKLYPERGYRLSGFVFAHPTDDAVLLKNTLTKQVYALSPEEWTAVQAADLSHPAAQELAKLRFLVERDYDEPARYGFALSVLRAMEEKKPGIAAYTILPTTACNARCVYCYEEGIVPRAMTPENADAVIDFICRTRREGEIRLAWFGGEPLLGAPVVSRICRALRDRGVEFASSIITNGTLLTPEMAAEAAELWKLKRAQVSMDGARQDYVNRKCYVNPELHNYDRAMEAAELFSDAGVNVVLRVNYDAENLPRMQEFFDDCAARFGERKNVGVYLEQLFQSATTEENAALYRAAAETESGLKATGLSPVVRGERRLRTSYCMADSGGRSVIIDPEGGLHRCEHDLGDEPFGSIFDATVRFPHTEPVLAPECGDCVFLPDCTAFRKSCCPVKTAACRTQMALRTERELEALLRRAAEAENAGEDEDESEDECP